MKEHNITVNFHVINDLNEKNRNFDIRHDLGFEVGDIIHYIEREANLHQKRNKKQVRCSREIIYITSFMQRENYVAIGLKEVGKKI